jgi:DNA-binding IclR family transcriptional regulator
MTQEAKPAGGGTQSLDSALVLLTALAAHPGAVALSDLARETGMPVSKVHRYLASFSAAGLVRQVAKSGKYDLGPGAMSLGLAALARHDFVNRTADGLPDLVAETGLTALLSVWGSFGATVVRWERGPGYMVTALGLGSTLPLLTSASGRVFLAWAPARVTAEVLEQELSRPVAAGIAVPALRQDLRRAGFAAVQGDLIPGLAAIAAPVLDWQGEAQAAVTLVGTDQALTDPAGPALAALRAFCSAQSVAGRDGRSAPAR